jgi:hypothetical protein
LDEPLKGRFVGEDIGPGGFIKSFFAQSFGGNASRGRIMRKVVSAGLRGSYAAPMAEFYRTSAASAREIFDTREIANERADTRNHRINCRHAIPFRQRRGGI